MWIRLRALRRYRMIRVDSSEKQRRQPFHGPITYAQSKAVEEYCQLHDPPYCWMIYWLPGHPFHRTFNTCEHNKDLLLEGA